MFMLSRRLRVREMTLAVLAAALLLTACDGKDEAGSAASASGNGDVNNACAAKFKAAGFERIPSFCRANRSGGAAGGGGQAVAHATTSKWNAEQLDNARVIVAVGREMGVPRRARVVALAAAMQESSLRNGACCDHDSLGLFQQRPSQGWGTPGQVTDRRYAARKFYSVLLTVSGWERMSVTRAAQQVQRSAYPDAYAKHESDADRLAD